jgi:hypothetical protein
MIAGEIMPQDIKKIARNIPATAGQGEAVIPP